MTPRVGAPSSWVILYQPSRVCSEVHLALTSLPSGSIGYLSAAGAVKPELELDEVLVLAEQPARPARPATVAEPSRKFLRVTLLFIPFPFRSCIL